VSEDAGIEPRTVVGDWRWDIYLQKSDPHFLGSWISKTFRNCLFSAFVLNINPKNPLSRKEYKNIYFPLYTLRKKIA
jgi:hypothetical protein